jgi:ketosteroid isomerase-like protein
MRVILLSFAVLCACGASPPSESPRVARSSIDRVLDDWHDAAAHSDEDRYFDHMADDAIFLGTDATERWTKSAFRAYAHPHFARGHGWVFRSVRRDVILDPSHRLAWFDEDLHTEGLGPARGSGVLRREADGEWRIVHYNLAITVPNERFAEVHALLSAPH